MDKVYHCITILIYKSCVILSWLYIKFNETILSMHDFNIDNEVLLSCVEFNEFS